MHYESSLQYINSGWEMSFDVFDGNDEFLVGHSASRNMARQWMFPQEKAGTS